MSVSIYYQLHTKYGEGNVFTDVCHFVRGGLPLEGGDLPLEGRPHGGADPPPGTVNQRSVRILLECILLLNADASGIWDVSLFLVHSDTFLVDLVTGVRWRENFLHFQFFF